MWVTAGIALALALIHYGWLDQRNAIVCFIAGSLYFGGTIGGALGHVYYGTDDAGESGFVLGGLLGIVMLFASVAMVHAWF